jgi:inhibitor of cysteine peptidase
MKRIGVMILLCLAMLTTQAAAPNQAGGNAASSTIRVILNGQPAALNVPPIMREGTVYVPLRSLLTAIGAVVEWDEQTGNVKTSHNDNEISIRSGSDQATVNGKSVTLDRPPFQASGNTYVSVRWLNETFGAVVKWQASSRTVSVYYPDDQLPTVGSLENLQTLLADSNYRSNMYGRGNVDMLVAFTTADTATANAPAAESKSMESNGASDATGASSASDYSTTNVQVQGVDEADVVKTDGQYIYQVNRERILITSAKPAGQMKVVSTLKYADGSFSPQEIYVDEQRLIVIGSGSPAVSYTTNAAATSSQSKKLRIMPIIPYIQTTVAIVYDISDITAPKEIRQLELEGSYLSSRKIGSSLYLISNKYLNYYGIQPLEGAADEAAQSDYQPMIRDSAIHDKLTPIPFTDIRYFPEFVEPNYMLVAGVDLNAGEPMNVQTFLGSGQNIYASTDSLYAAVTRAEDTAIYKFSLHPSGVVYMAEGSVPGRILNQFSMDEFEGHFRIATTTGHVWGEGNNLSKNNLYILGDALQAVGKIEDIAPGEQIYSVRFVGKRAYMVTFRTVDPLFVIDVEHPSAPKILGALKIPGYSDYLHPYDENHIIGFGKDTLEVSTKDANGKVTGVNAFYLGMKVALFDVTDVANPKELHKTMIGDRGTHSELLYNHKALLFDKEKNLLAFPVDLYEVKQGAKEEYGMPAYGTFAYQGAYVYKLDPINGFQLRGRITHLTTDELAKAGNYWFGDKSVNRILYIADQLYTLSNGMIKANGLADLSQTSELELPAQ